MFVDWRKVGAGEAKRNESRVGGLNAKQIEFLNRQVEFLMIEEDYSESEAMEEVWERWANTPEIVMIGKEAV